MASLGEAIGRQAVAELEASGELDWIVRDATLSALEDALLRHPDADERDRQLALVAVARERLGPRPRQAAPRDGVSLVGAVAFVLLLVAAAAIIAWTISHA